MTIESTVSTVEAAAKADLVALEARVAKIEADAEALYQSGKAKFDAVVAKVKAFLPHIATAAAAYAAAHFGVFSALLKLI